MCTALGVLVQHLRSWIGFLFYHPTRVRMGLVVIIASSRLAVSLLYNLWLSVKICGSYYIRSNAASPKLSIEFHFYPPHLKVWGYMVVIASSRLPISHFPPLTTYHSLLTFYHFAKLTINTASEERKEPMVIHRDTDLTLFSLMVDCPARTVLGST